MDRRCPNRCATRATPRPDGCASSRARTRINLKTEEEWSIALSTSLTRRYPGVKRQVRLPWEIVLGPGTKSWYGQRGCRQRAGRPKIVTSLHNSYIFFFLSFFLHESLTPPHRTQLYKSLNLVVYRALNSSKLFRSLS